jgi:long-chain acyl-CoA synthetase
MIDDERGRGQLTGESLFVLLDRALARARENPRHPFMIVDGQIFALGDLADRLGRLSTLTRDLGLVSGDPIGILTRSPYDMASLLIAGLWTGLSVINLNPDLSGSERRLAISAAGLRHVFADRELVEAAPLDDVGVTIMEPAVAADGGLVGRLLGRRQAPVGGLDALLAAVAPSIPAGRTQDETATALMLFTSGTMSRPKVVELSRANIAAQVQTFLRLYGYGPDCRILNPLPLHFTDGILHGPLIAFLSGATLIRPRVFDFQKVEDMMLSIYRDRITHFVVVPALLSFMDRLGGRFDDAFESPDFRYIRSSGDRLPEVLWRAVQDRYRVRVINTYGLSETVCEAIYCGPDDSHYRVGTIGKPVDCEARIVDDGGAEVPPGETGELIIRGTNIMKGYRGQPELTAETVVDGWLRTGDFATRDEEGFITIVGRKKSLIISGGTNIQPQDIVDCLLGHPGVAEAFALGLPDPVFNEIAACAVVPRGEALTEVELVAHCRGNLAPYKVPRRFLMLPELPRNAAGKVLVSELAARFDEGARGGPVAESDIQTEVVSLAASVFRCSPNSLSPASTPRDTPGWDSLAHMALIAAVEQRFGIRLSAKDMLRVGRLGDLATIARKHGSEG